MTVTTDVDQSSAPTAGTSHADQDVNQEDLVAVNIASEGQVVSSVPQEPLETPENACNDDEEDDDDITVICLEYDDEGEFQQVRVSF